MNLNFDPLLQYGSPKCSRCVHFVLHPVRELGLNILPVVCSLDSECCWEEADAVPDRRLRLYWLACGALLSVNQKIQRRYHRQVCPPLCFLTIFANLPVASTTPTPVRSLSQILHRTTSLTAYQRLHNGFPKLPSQNYLRMPAKKRRMPAMWPSSKATSPTPKTSKPCLKLTRAKAASGA